MSCQSATLRTIDPITNQTSLICFCEQNCTTPLNQSTYVSCSDFIQYNGPATGLAIDNNTDLAYWSIPDSSGYRVVVVNPVQQTIKLVISSKSPPFTALTDLYVWEGYLFMLQAQNVI